VGPRLSWRSEEGWGLPIATVLVALTVALENLLVRCPVPFPLRRIRHSFGLMLFMTPSPEFC